MRSSRVSNLGGSDPFWYLVISTGSRCPMEPSLVGAEGPYKASELGSEVGSEVGFSLGCLGSKVGSAKGGSLRDSRVFSSSSSESYG